MTWIIKLVPLISSPLIRKLAVSCRHIIPPTPILYLKTYEENRLACALHRSFVTGCKRSFDPDTENSQLKRADVSFYLSQPCFSLSFQPLIHAQAAFRTVRSVTVNCLDGRNFRLHLRWKSNSQLLAPVSFVFRDKILKHIHTY